MSQSPPEKPTLDKNCWWRHFYVVYCMVWYGMLPPSYYRTLVPQYSSIQYNTIIYIVLYNTQAWPADSGAGSRQPLSVAHAHGSLIGHRVINPIPSPSNHDYSSNITATVHRPSSPSSMHLAAVASALAHTTCLLDAPIKAFDHP